MHDLAIALKSLGYTITGSDKEFSKSIQGDLEKHLLLPPEQGWNPDRIDASLEAVIIGAGTPVDNPELLKAQSLSIPVKSLPEIIHDQASDKHRMVIVGSAEKSLITNMILQVLRFHKRSFDFLLGHSNGTSRAVALSDAPLIVIEGDDTSTSCLDPLPVFRRFHHHIGLVCGIDWKASAQFPVARDYISQFELFEDETPKGGTLIYAEQDPVVSTLSKKERPDIQVIPYKGGAGHAAIEALKKIGITSEMFSQAIPHLPG